MKSDERKLVDDRFTVTRVDNDPAVRYFKNVTRVHMESKYNIKLSLDINTTIFPVEKGDSYLVVITRKIGQRNVYQPDELAKASEKDDYDYVCYGTVFQTKEDKEGVSVFASFGGLLMRLTADEEIASGFRKDTGQSRIYLMLKKS